MELAEETSLELPQALQVEPVGPGKPGHSSQAGSPAFMSFDTFSRLVAQFPGLRELRLQGAGDPLVHPRFLDMAREASSRGIRVSALTALPPVSHRRAEACVKCGLEKLDILLPAGSGSALFWRNVDRLAGMKKQLGAVLPWLRLTVPVSRIDELPAALRLARLHGMDAVSVQHLSARRTRRDALPADLAERLEDAAALADELGMRLEPPEPKRAGGCDSPWRSAFIGYYGLARPCAMVGAAERISFGNMAREGVVRIWNRGEYQAFRGQLASGHPAEVCRSCAVYQSTVS